jgi:hypothetical protein
MFRPIRTLLLALALVAVTAAPSEAHKLTIKRAERSAAARVPEVIMNMVEPFGFQPEEFGWGKHRRTGDHRVVIELIVVDWGDERARLDKNEECVSEPTTACSVLMPVSFASNSHRRPKRAAVVESAKRSRCLTGHVKRPKPVKNAPPIRRPDRGSRPSR